MASRLLARSVLHDLTNFGIAEPAPPQFAPLAVYPSTTTRPRSPKSHLKALSKSIIPGPRTSKRTEARLNATSLEKLPDMASESSSRSSGSRHSKSEQSGDDEWIPSKGSESVPDNQTTKIEVFRFMDLPEELRRLMYSYFLSIPPGVEFQLDQSIIDWSFSAVSATILKVSKEVYLEAFPVFLRENKFLIGTSLTNPGIFRNFGPKRCAYLRSLSIQLNDRPLNDCIQILDELSQYCKEIRNLELRVSPGSHFLPRLTSILVARTQADSSSRTNVVFRVSVRKLDAVLATGQADVDRAAEDIRQSFQSIFRWPQILERAHEVTIKGCIHKSSLDVLEKFQHEGWHFERTSTTLVEGCTTSQENVTRTWEPIDRGVQSAEMADVRNPQRWR